MNAPTNDLISPWQPETNADVLKAIGKLGEECSELSACILRCVIQGLHASEPVTGKPNLVWLAEEIADVRACLTLLSIYPELIPLDWDFIEKRTDRKLAGFVRWQEEM